MIIEQQFLLSRTLSLFLAYEISENARFAALTHASRLAVVSRDA